MTHTMKRSREVCKLFIALMALTVTCAVIAACADESPKSASPSAPTSQGDNAVAITDCPLRILVQQLSSNHDMTVTLDRFEAFNGPLRFAPAMRESVYTQLPAKDCEEILVQYMADQSALRTLLLVPLVNCVRDLDCANRARAIAILRRWINDNDSENVVLFFSESAKNMNTLLNSHP